MLNVYPSNRLEDLAQLLVAVLHLPKDNVLQPDIVLVQNGGMQHWLNLQLAYQRGISMNLDFHLPASFSGGSSAGFLAGKRCRTCHPTRGSLVLALVRAAGRQCDYGEPLCREATDYWRKSPGDADSLRFQLARELADLFEQYLIYRPDWISAWDRGETPHWQAFLWQRLAAEVPAHPSDCCGVP